MTAISPAGSGQPLSVPAPEAMAPAIQALLDHAACGFLVCDLLDDGGERIGYASPSMERLTGHAPEDIMRLGALDSLTDEAGRMALREAMAKARTQGEGAVVFRLRQRNGDWKWLNNRFSVAGRADGRITLACVLADITPESAAQADVAAATRRLEALIGNAPGLLAQSERRPDGSWRRTFVSDNAERVLGYSAAALTEPGAWDALLDAESSQARDRATEEAIRTGQAAYDLTMRHAAGHRVPLRATIRATCAAPDHWLFTATMLDQTALREAEAARAAAEAQVTALVNDAPGVLFQSDLAPDGSCRRVFVSANAVRVTGHTAEELMAPGRWDAMFDETSLRVREQATQRAKQDGSASYECTIRHAGGHAVPVRIAFRAAAGPDGHWQFTGTLQDIADLHAAQAARAAAEARMAELLNDSPAIVFEAEQWPDGSNRRNFISDNVQRYLGFSAEQMREVGNWIDRLDSEGLASRSAAMAEALRTGHAAFDCWARHADGHRLRIRIAFRATQLGPDHWRFNGTALDISALHEATEARTAAEARVSELVNGAPGVLFQSELTPDGQWRRTFISANATRIIGFPLEQLYAFDGWTGLLDTAGRAAHAEAIRQAMQSGSAEYECWARHGDGHRIRTRTSFVGQEIQPGHWRFTGNVLDVTAVYAADEARAAAEARIAALVNESSSVLAEYTIGQDGVWRAEYFSANILRLTGYTAEQMLLLRTRGSLLVDDEGRRNRLAAIDRAVQTGHSSFDAWIRTAAGQRRRVRFQLRAVPAMGGNTRVVAVLSDITDLHEAEQARADAEAKLFALVNESPGAVGQYTLRRDGSRSADLFSDNVERIIGYPAAYLSSPDIVGDIFDDDEGRQARDAAWQEAIRTGRSSYEAWICHGGGHRVRARFTLRAMPAEDESWRIIAVLQDVTDLHEANLARAEAEARLAAMVQEGPGVLFQVTGTPTAGWRRDYASDNLVRLCGYTNAQIVERGGWDALLDAEGVAARDAAIERAMQSGEGNYEAWIHHADGHRVRVRTTLRATRTESGDCQIIGISLDATALHEANEARARAEARVAALVDDSPGIMFQHMVLPSGEWQRLYMSNTVRRVLGYTPDEMLRANAWLAPIDDEGRQAQQAAAAEAMRSGESIYECWVRHADGHHVRIRTAFRAVRREDGSWLFTGYGQDVTALHEATRARALAEAKLATLVGDAPGMLFQLLLLPGGIWRRLFMSESTLRVVGYTSEEMLRDGAWAALLDEEGRQAFGQAVDEAIRTGASEYQCWVRHASGHRVLIRTSYRAAPDADGNWLFTGYAQDVTALHEANQARARAEARVATLVANAPGMLFQVAVSQDGVWRRIYTSETVVRVLGYTPEYMTADGAARRCRPPSPTGRRRQGNPCRRSRIRVLGAPRRRTPRAHPQHLPGGAQRGWRLDHHRLRPGCDGAARSQRGPRARRGAAGFAGAGRPRDPVPRPPGRGRRVAARLCLAEYRQPDGI